MKSGQINKCESLLISKKGRDKQIERHKLTEKEKDIIGRKCANCGEIDDVQYHHIVPLALGGKDIISNMVCLCSDCHYLIHHGKPNKVNFSRAIKAGQKRAIENGSHLGCLPLSVQRIEPNIIGDIARYDKGISSIKIPEIAKKYGLSRNTLYAYIHILNNEIYNGRRPPTKYDSLVTREDYYNLNDGTLLDVMQIGCEWSNDRDEWINCVKEGNKLHILSNYTSYYDIDECDITGYEYIIKYNNSS